MGFTKSKYREGRLPKRGLAQFANLRGAWQERGGGGVDTPMHIMEYSGNEKNSEEINDNFQ